MAKPALDMPSVKDAFESVFTRSQVEWALWHHDPHNAKRKPTRSFKIRVKHLLEFDRAEPVKSPARSLAFSDEPPGGRGEHSLFSVFDAFMLEAALGFLGLGFKRKEVVIHLRLRRSALRKGLSPILNERLKQIKKGDAGPIARSNLSRVLIHAASLDDAPEALKPLSDVPFFASTEEMLQNIDDRPRLVVLDLSFSAHHLPHSLLSAPLRKRGRS